MDKNLIIGFNSPLRKHKLTAVGKKIPIFAETMDLTAFALLRVMIVFAVNRRVLGKNSTQYSKKNKTNFQTARR